MQPTGTDRYFVRLDAVPTASHPALVDHDGGRAAEPTRRRRRRRVRIRPSVVLLLGLAAWFAWAAARPGGVSGTINGWIDHVRGDVVKVSADPDLHRAATYFNQEYASTGSYPRLTDDQLATAGIGIGVTVEWCAPDAIVLMGAQGGGDASRLLLGGRELGTVPGRQDCPADLAHPAPWKA